MRGAVALVLTVGLAHLQPALCLHSTALGLAGKGFALIAADTRLSKGYSILSRNVSKIAQL